MKKTKTTQTRFTIELTGREIMHVLHAQGIIPRESYLDVVRFESSYDRHNPIDVDSLELTIIYSDGPIIHEEQDSDDIIKALSSPGSTPSPADTVIPGTHAKRLKGGAKGRTTTTVTAIGYDPRHRK